MKFGIFYEHQLPRPWAEDSEYRLLQNSLEQIELADRLGYDFAWEVEHHFLEEYSHSSAPEVFLAAASQRTKNIRLGHGIIQLTTNHPARVAERVGLLNTMVFTHLPSNLLLVGVPFMPSFETAASLLLLRHVLSQMDVPTRQAFTMALVAPEERPAASGLTASARALAQAGAPLLTGLLLTSAASPAPFLLAGGIKSVYDLTLFFRFRSRRP